MRMLLLLLVACDAGSQPSPPVAAPRPAYGREPIVLGTHTFAVVTLVEWADRCIDSISTHYTFALDDGTPRVVHAMSGEMTLPHGWNRDAPRYYVAEVEGLAPNTAIAASGNCADEKVTYAGEVKRLVPATSLADARQRLAAIQRDGWPATSYTVGF